MLALLSALIAAPLLVVVAPADSGHVDAARATATAALEVEGWSQVPGPVCAQNPACVAAGVTRGDAVLWTSPVSTRFLVRVARRPDGAVIVEELVDTEAAVGPAVSRLVGQVPAGLTQLNTTTPLVAPVVAGGAAAAAPVVVEEEGVPVIWWVVGGVAVAAVIAGVFVGALVLGDARQSGNAGDGCGACLNGVFGNCFVCTGFSDAINSACTSACGDVTGSFTDSCSGLGDGLSGSCDGLTGACDGLGNLGSCAVPMSTSTPTTVSPLLAPPAALTTPTGPADGNMAW